jgi:hypothetical protein
MLNDNSAETPPDAVGQELPNSLFEGRLED